MVYTITMKLGVGSSFEQANGSLRTEKEVKYLLESKQKLLECLRISLSSALPEAQVEEHPAILAQQYYISALKWVLGEQEEL